MAAARRNPQIGDVFVIPIDRERVGIGQVVGKHGGSDYYFAIYDWTGSPPGQAELSQVLRERVLFLALSLDGKLHAKHWTIVGQEAIPGSIKLPAYKMSVGYPPQFFVVDHSGKLRRPAKAEEVEVLPYRTVVAPVRLEKALRAKCGLEPWHEDYSALSPEGQITSEQVFG